MCASFLPSGDEQLVDHVKANISRDGGDARRKREMGTIGGTNRSLLPGWHKAVTSPSIRSLRRPDALAPLVLVDTPLKRVDFSQVARGKRGEKRNKRKSGS